MVARFLLLLCAAAGLFGQSPAEAAPKRKTYSLEGRLMPVRFAMVSLHAVDSPYAADTPVYWDGKFKFKGLSQGTYVVTAYVPRVGEFRQTYSIGPSTTDNKGRMQVTIYAHPSRATRTSTPQERFTVSATRLSISDKAIKHYQDALRKLRKGDRAAAVALLEKAVALSPQFAAAWNQLGTLAYQQKNFELAERHFREGHEQDKDLFEPVVNLGGVLLQLGRLDEALRFNQEAVKRRPRDPLANSQLGLTYFAQKRYDLAIEYLNVAKRMDPGHISHPQLTLSDIYLRLGRASQAAAELENFLRYHPDSPQAGSIRAAIEKLRQP